MAKSPEVEHLEKAVQAARKALDHIPLAVNLPDETEEEIGQLGPEAQ